MQPHEALIGRLVMVRHGESVWNEAGRFTGWTNVDLTERGCLQAQECARRLTAHGLHFDTAFVSTLSRTRRSAEIILAALGTPCVPILADKALDERDYGDLAGLTKPDADAAYGAGQVSRWRRGYADRPPGGESLCDVRRRAAEYLDMAIRPRVAHGKQILLVGHGNTLRALIMTIECLSSQEIERLEVETGRGMIYEHDGIGFAAKIGV